VPEPFLAVEKVSLAYRTGSIVCQALDGATLEFAPGRLTLVMGPSGSGKTSLLSVLGCLLAPDAGRVFVAGRETGRLSDRERTRLRRSSVGFIFQAFRLFHALSALDNVVLAGQVRGRADRRRARQLLEDLGIMPKAHLKPRALSGGERQRVAIARALIGDPRVLLADEPTASLDSHAGRQIGDIMVRLAHEEGRAVVVVSHDPRWEGFADRVIALEDGRVTQDRKGGLS
jgi:putative ABC transport system ATP-binding protein